VVDHYICNNDTTRIL